MLPSPRSHIYRLILVLVIGVGGFFLVKDFFKPESWDERSWYRRDALPLLQQQASIFGGNESCQSSTCHAQPEKDHDEKLGLLTDAIHDGLACEGCHGALGEHARNGEKVADARLVRDSSLCLRCHDQRIGRAEKVAQFSETFKKHKRKKVTRTSECIECHDPHAPADKKEVIAAATPAAATAAAETTSAGAPASAEGATAAPSLNVVGLAITCNNCHGERGASAGAMMPTIGGQTPVYLKTVMLQFKSGERASTAMGRLLAGYSDDELAALAEYYARQKWTNGAQPTDSALAEKGAALHEEHCAECHEEAGRTGDEETPRLAGQWQVFLELELEKYRDKEIEMPYRRMRRAARKLSDDDVTAISQFYAGQKD